MTVSISVSNRTKAFGVEKSEPDTEADPVLGFNPEVEVEVEVELEGFDSGKQTNERARRRAVVACMVKCRTLHQGVMRTNHAISGSSGRMEIREHAAWRQSVARLVLNFAR
jgi:hypothetical protein